MIVCTQYPCLQGVLRKRPGSGRAMVDVLALVLLPDKSRVERLLEAGLTLGIMTRVPVVNRPGRLWRLLAPFQTGLIDWPNSPVINSRLSGGFDTTRAMNRPLFVTWIKPIL